MAARFRAEFALYKTRVPRLMPELCRWQDADEILVRPVLVYRTFWDAMLFLAAAPALRGLEALRDTWLIPRCSASIERPISLTPGLQTPINRPTAGPLMGPFFVLFGTLAGHPLQSKDLRLEEAGPARRAPG